MPLYTFELQDGDRPIGDETGVWFGDRERALDHAHDVARELMNAREVQTRWWRLDVYEDGVCVDAIPFARVDRTLDHLNPTTRSMVERSYDAVRSFRQTVSTTRATLRESRALLARSQGKPYLATEAGQPTIRTSPPVAERKTRRSGARQNGGIRRIK
jgi:hypothetical protein